MAPLQAAPLPEQPGECPGPGEPQAAVRADRAAPLGLLDREPGAALGAARAQYFAAACGLHPAAETMGALAANHRWLVGAFHDLPSYEKALH